MNEQMNQMYSLESVTSNEWTNESMVQMYLLESATSDEWTNESNVFVRICYF